MDDLVRKDALKIIERVIEILKVKDEKDVFELKDLSNHTIHNASVFQDECSVSIVVVIYALSKIIERNPEQLNYKKIIGFLQKSRSALKNNEDHSLKLAIRKLFSEISTIDNKLSLYIHEVSMMHR